jgi:PKD repeat protein
LVATDNLGATGGASKSITVTAPAANTAPTAAFVVSCTALTCRFTDRSTDVDGSVVARRWTFGNGTSATAVNPSRTYAAGGTYTVTLRVTDDDGATNTRSQAITITSAIRLTVTGRVDATKQYVTVKWSGARGTTVDLYRNRKFLKQEANDGLYTASRLLPGLSKYIFSVCELGSTTLCSNESTITF